VAAGFNYRIDEPRAAFAEERLRRLDDENRERARLDGRYRDALRDLPGLEPTLAPVAGAVSANHLFTVVVDDGVDRERVRASLRERGIQSSVHYPSVHRFSIYSDPPVELPLTEAYASRTITLPLFPHMSDAQQDLVIEALESAVATAAAVR
jgi:dTDP-4-amino-4,6-dideoxygalactose transaminase